MSDKKSEESVPVEEVKIPKTISITQVAKSVVVLLISLFCILLGISIYQVYRPLHRFYLVQPQPKKTEAPVVHHETPVVKTVVPELGEIVPTPKAIEIPIPTAETKPEPVEPEPSFEEISETVEPEENTESVNELSERLPTPTEPQLDKITLTEALTLRDKLYLGQNCLADFQILLKRQLPAELKETLIPDLMPVCSARPLYPELKSAFLKNKKAAFLTYYKMHNPTWLAYTKSFLTRLVDFRRLNPVKKKPKDIIYSSQNALMQNDVSHSLEYIQQLPPEIQPDFSEYMALAGTYLTAQRAVEQLILSFDVKGE